MHYREISNTVSHLEVFRCERINANQIGPFSIFLWVFLWMQRGIPAMVSSGGNTEDIFRERSVLPIIHPLLIQCWHRLCESYCVVTALVKGGGWPQTETGQTTLRVRTFGSNHCSYFNLFLQKQHWKPCSTMVQGKYLRFMFTPLQQQTQFWQHLKFLVLFHLQGLVLLSLSS